MRIAPKPKVGQEISLDELLKGGALTRPEPTNFSVTIDKHAMTVTGVKILGKVYTVEIQNQLLAPKPLLDDFLHMAKERFEKGDPRPASTEEIYAIFSKLAQEAYQNPTSDQRRILQATSGVEKLKEIWKDYQPICTFTSVFINPGTKADSVLHLEGTDLAHHYFGQVAGPDGYLVVRDTPAQNICQMLFDEQNPAAVSWTFMAFTGSAIQIKRSKSPQESPMTSMVLIGKKYLVACGGGYTSRNGFPSLGITIREAMQ